MPFYLMRSAYSGSGVFETYTDILDAGCTAWNRLIAQLEVINSIGARKWTSICQA